MNSEPDVLKAAAYTQQLLILDEHDRSNSDYSSPSDSLVADLEVAMPFELLSPSLEVLERDATYWYEARRMAMLQIITAFGLGDMDSFRLYEEALMLIQDEIKAGELNDAISKLELARARGINEYLSTR